MLSIKQGGIKYHFLSFRNDSTWDWTPLSRTIGEHSSHLTNDLIVPVSVPYMSGKICLKIISIR